MPETTQPTASPAPQAPVHVTVAHNGTPSHFSAILGLISSIFQAELPVILQLVPNKTAQTSLVAAATGVQIAASVAGSIDTQNQ